MPQSTSAAARFLRALLVMAVLALSPAWSTPITMVNHGPSSNRVDMVFLGDGYTAADLRRGTYADHVGSLLDYMFSPGLNQEPFYRYRNYFNAYRIDVVSNESGADVPGQRILRDTALDASYKTVDGVPERLLSVDAAKADAVLAAELADANFTADMRFVTVNETRRGGGGGTYAIFAGGAPGAGEVALHEVGHSFGRLADEYGGNGQRYAGPEPVEANVTADPTGSKWAPWQGFDQPGIGVIGAYRGAASYDAGLYRPSAQSKMRALGNPFDAIAREKIILAIYALTDPLDAWLDNSRVLIDPSSLWVDAIDPEVITVEWLVDDVPVQGAIGETFNPIDFGFSSGSYMVTAHAFDPTGFDPANGWVRRDASNLEESVSWRVQLAAVPEPATVLLVAVGFSLLLLSRRVVFAAHAARA